MTTSFNDVDDVIGVQAQWGAERTLDYFKTVHGLDSYDGNGTTLRSFVGYDKNL